jgi:non-heme Fe2+,alpha-ketoglutarate-dependent halogenase
MAVKTFFDPKPEDQSRNLAFFPAEVSDGQKLSHEELDRFNREGFLTGLPAFSATEITKIRAYLDELIATVLAADDRRNAYSINAYHLVCAGIYDLVLSPVLLDYVEDILGPVFGSWGNHLFCKLPGDPMAVPLHQDASYWPITPSRTVTVWIAIDDADPENSAMEFATGSHLHGPLPHEDLPLDGSRVLKRQVVDPESYGERTSNSMRAGEISLHSDLLLHGSQPNRSPRRRAGLTIRYAAGEVRALPGHEYWLKPGVHCRGQLPEHWPHRSRPEGEHPEKLAHFSGDFDGNPMPEGNSGD